MNNQRKFDAGHHFETETGIYKYLETPYGQPYVSRLYKGQWIFAFHVIEFRDLDFTYQTDLLDSKSEFSISYENLKFLLVCT